MTKTLDDWPSWNCRSLKQAITDVPGECRCDYQPKDRSSVIAATRAAGATMV
jgi:hypothetical protein